MAVNVPFPFRVAAGAIAVGLDRLRTLPAELPALSVTLAGHAVRASMRVQQELANLAARGEEVLSPLTDRPEEHPAWAHFDDEDDVVDGDAVDDATERDAAGDDPAGDDPAGDDPGDDAGVPASGAGGGREYDAAPGVAGGATDGPAALRGYDELTVAQVRARLRTLDEAAVAELLEHERAGRARAAFVTTLHNRLASLRSGGAAGDGAARDGAADTGAAGGPAAGARRKKQV
jgi:hypothetical protein